MVNILARNLLQLHKTQKSLLKTGKKSYLRLSRVLWSCSKFWRETRYESVSASSLITLYNRRGASPGQNLNFCSKGVHNITYNVDS